MIPELESHCGSWVIIDRKTARPVLETFQRSTAEKVNQSRYEVLTTLQWLTRFNRQVTEG